MIVRGNRIEIADREGLRSFLKFNTLGEPLLYYEKLLHRDTELIVDKATRLYFWVAGYRLRRSNFERYFRIIK